MLRVWTIALIKLDMVSGPTLILSGTDNEVRHTSSIFPQRGARETVVLGGGARGGVQFVGNFLIDAGLESGVEAQGVVAPVL